MKKIVTKAETFAIRMRVKAGDMMLRAENILSDESGEGYVDTAIKILTAVVLGALLLAGLYALFSETVMPTLTQRVKDMFNYAG